MERVVLSLVLLILPFLSANGKEFASINITQKDGLVSDNVFDVIQDDDGSLWFATGSGVSKYNGIKFENFTSANGLADNTCYYFRKDKEGRLWIGNNSGLLQYYKNGVFHTEKNTPFLHLPFKGGIITDMRVEKDSSITIFFSDRMIFVSILHNKIRCFDLRKSDLMNATIVDIEYKNSNCYSLICETYKVDIDTNGKLKNRIEHPGNIILSRLVVGRDQEYYIDKSNYYFTRQFKRLGKLPNRVSSEYTINRIAIFDNKHFISTTHGLYIDSIASFNNIFVTTVFKDRNGNFWITSIRDGVFKLSKDFQKSFKLSNNLHKQVVFAQSIGDKLFISSSDRSFSVYTKGVLSFYFSCEKKASMSFDGTIFGNLIVNNTYLNLHGYYPYIAVDIDKKPKVKVISQQSLFDVINVKYIDSEIYITNRHGNWKFHYDFKKNIDYAFFNKLHNNLKNKIPTPESVLPERISSVDYSADNNAFWFTTTNNVFKMSGGKTTLDSQLCNLNILKLSIFGKYMFCITNNNKLLILKNFASGQLLVDSGFNQDCVWENFKSINDSTILAFTNDYYRVITFFPSNKGIKYNIKVLDNPFIPQHADYFCIDSNVCYFFKRSEIYKFPIEEIFKSFGPPTICFQKLKTPFKELPISPVISLSYADSREINIWYSAISLNSKELIYEYSISTDTFSKNKKWFRAYGESISLLKIGSGSYSIDISAKTPSGIYSTVQSFKLIIAKPFWLSWWFFSALLFSLILAVVLVIKLIIKKKNVEREKEIRFLQSEYRSLNALMKPHFIFNSINNVQGLINSNQRQAASEYLRTISDLIRQNMYNISGDFITMEKEIALIKNYLKLEKLRFNDLLNYEINIDPAIELDLIKIPPLLIQPLVENAVKYGLWQSGVENGFIAIHIYYDAEEYVIVDVIDNGKGFASSGFNDIEHHSTALNNIKKRIAQLQIMYARLFEFSIQELMDENGNITGVKASVRMDE